MNISDLLSSFTHSDSLSALSQSSGAQPNQISNLLKTALPILMKGMAQNAGSESGANALSKALDAHSGVNTSNLGALLKNADVTDGTKILGHILGTKNTEVQKGLAQKTGLSSSQTGTILASVAPMLLSVLGGQKKEMNVGNSGLGSMLSGFLGGSGNLNDMISSALADNDGDGTPDVIQKLGNIFGKK